MKNRSKLLIVGASALALAASGGGLAVAGSGGDDVGDSEAPIASSQLDEASAAALENVGEGTVTDTEVEDEESYYEVEVTRGDGSQVDVQLDRDFDVLAPEGDGPADD